MLTYIREDTVQHKKAILHIDMDCVLADFCKGAEEHGFDRNMKAPPCMYEQGFFLDLKPVEGSLKAVRALIGSGLYDINILTQPLAYSPISYTEKVMWIGKWFPELLEKIIMTQDKTLIKGQYLIDDNLKWQGFEGRFVHFDPLKDSKRVWEDIVNELLS